MGIWKLNIQDSGSRTSFGPDNFINILFELYQNLFLCFFVVGVGVVVGG